MNPKYGTVHSRRIKERKAPKYRTVTEADLRDIPDVRDWDGAENQNRVAAMRATAGALRSVPLYPRPFC